MTPDSEILRGFGLVFQRGGGVRSWYVGSDGVKRCAVTAEPVPDRLPLDIAIPYPLQELEASEGVCAQEGGE